jgi:hypothetical protein
VKRIENLRNAVRIIVSANWRKSNCRGIAGELTVKGNPGEKNLSRHVVYDILKLISQHMHIRSITVLFPSGFSRPWGSEKKEVIG